MSQAGNRMHSKDPSRLRIPEEDQTVTRLDEMRGNAKIVQLIIH
jgi:hypothetical protein